MRLERLPIFIDLYETHSYTKTAQKNYVSQASVTQLVNSLEEEFGVKLFDRFTLPIQATAAGKQLYHDAKILLRQYIQLKEVLPRLEQEGASQIRLCYTSQIDLQILLPFVRQFKAAHPAVAFQVELCPFRDASQMLWAGKCDGAIGIDFEPEFTQGMETLVLYEGEYQALVPQGHPLFQREVLSREELYQYPLVMLSPEVLGRSYDGMIRHAQLDGYYSSDGMVTFGQAIREGKMDVWTDDFQKLTGQQPMTVLYMFQHSDQFQVGERHSKDN